MLLLFVFTIWLAGCANQLGETRAEINRNHLRTLRIDIQQLLDDIDRALLLDQPSKLTDKLVQ